MSFKVSGWVDAGLAVALAASVGDLMGKESITNRPLLLMLAIAGLATYGTVFSWINLLLAAGNLLPLYQHDGWKCGVVLMRSLLPGRSQPVEWAFTFSGGFVSLAIVAAMIRVFS